MLASDHWRAIAAEHPGAVNRLVGRFKSLMVRREVEHSGGRPNTSSSSAAGPPGRSVSAFRRNVCPWPREILTGSAPDLDADVTVRDSHDPLEIRRIGSGRLVQETVGLRNRCQAIRRLKCLGSRSLIMADCGAGTRARCVA